MINFVGRFEYSDSGLVRALYRLSGGRMGVTEWVANERIARELVPFEAWV